jgi:GDP-L-fucose synthase
MRALVTGATGFLGVALCRRLVSEGHEVIALGSKNADLRHEDSLNQFTVIQFDQIYHLAAWTQAGDFCLRHPGEQWIINQKINTNVLSWWQQHQPRAKMICMGTSCSYDPQRELVEENYLVGEPIESLYTYAMTKRMLQVGLQSLQRQFGLKYLTLVPSTLYGPGYHTDGRQMHFIFDLIRKILDGAKRGVPVVLWGDGHQRRELVYIEDFVGAALKLAAACENEIINIGAGAEHSIREFAAIICQKVGYPAEAIEYDIGRYVGAKSKCLSISKVRRLLPSLELISLDSGLERTIEWLAAQDLGPAVIPK